MNSTSTGAMYNMTFTIMLKNKPADARILVR